MRHHYRHPVRAFLHIHGPSVAACASLAVAVLAGALDYATQPHGFMRFAVLIIRHIGA